MVCKVYNNKAITLKNAWDSLNEDNYSQHLHLNYLFYPHFLLKSAIISVKVVSYGQVYGILSVELVKSCFGLPSVELGLVFYFGLQELANGYPQN